MLDQLLKQSYEKAVLQPIIYFLGNSISPMLMTGLSGALGILFLPALFFKHPYLAVLLLVASGFCDTLDGALARFQNKSSDLGAVMDIMMDRLVEFLIICALYLEDMPLRAPYIVAMLGSILLCITSFLVVGIFSNQNSHKSFYYSPGLMERAEAFLFFAAMVIMPEYFCYLAIVFTVLVLITAGMRLMQFARAC